MDDNKRHSSSRRDVLRAGALGAVASATPFAAGTATAQTQDATLDRLMRPDPKRRVLLKGATILSMDSKVGDFARGDILIDGKKITAVGADLGAVAGGDAIVIEAAERIIIPGMVDCHRHAWEGQIRGIIPNSVNIGDYMGATHRGFAPFYRPEDMYVGNFATALGCLDAGITTVIDCSHNARSQAHSDSAIKAWFDSGIRAVHASGAPTFGDWDKRWPNDSERLMKQFFSSDDQLVTFRLFSRGLTKDDWEAAKRLGVWLSVDGAGAPNNAQTLQEFQKADLLDEKHTINHGYGLADDSFKLIRDAGIAVNACPRSDAQWALGNARMGLQGALNFGIRPGLSVDNDTAYSTDLFTEMHVAFHLQRWTAHMARAQKEPDPAAPLSVRDMLEFATIRGAENAALGAKAGSLTPGKEADLVIIRAEDVNTMPLTNAVATVVQYAHAGNVEAVFVGGNVRKWRGALVGHDLAAARKRIHESRDALFERRRMKLDVLA